MKTLDLIIIVCLAIALLSGMFLICYYFINHSNECINNPFVFGAKQLEEKYDVEIYGVVTAIPPVGKKSSIITFNSANFSIQ